VNITVHANKLRVTVREWIEFWHGGQT
jgi:hypothetical protein